MVSTVKSLGIWGIDGYIIDVECSVMPGMPSFDIVGLPDTAVKESKERVMSAIKYMGFDFPLGTGNGLSERYHIEQLITGENFFAVDKSFLNNGKHSQTAADDQSSDLGESPEKQKQFTEILFIKLHYNPSFTQYNIPCTFTKNK